MRKVDVWMTQSVSINIELEVDDAATDEEIEQQVYKKFTGLQCYVGNNGNNKIIGVSDDDITIEPLDDLELNEIREEGQ